MIDEENSDIKMTKKWYFMRLKVVNEDKPVGQLFSSFQ